MPRVRKESYSDAWPPHFVPAALDTHGPAMNRVCLPERRSRLLLLRNEAEAGVSSAPSARGSPASA